MMNVFQARVLVIGLEAEIRSEGRMKFTREPAMKSLERLTGIDVYATFGRGMKGRHNALAWLLDILAEQDKIEAEEELEEA